MSDLETRIGHWYDDIAEMSPNNLEARRDVELGDGVGQEDPAHGLV